MKILIISDSHGLENNQEIINYENCDIALHLGDSQLMANDRDLSQFDVKVRGNCDFDRNFPISEVIEIADLRFFLTHGHYYDVNYGLSSLKNEAKLNHCDFALYGHTHVVNVDIEDEVVVLNPGSTRKSRSQYPESYMVLNITTTEYIISLKNAKSLMEIKNYKIPRNI